MRKLICCLLLFQGEAKSVKKSALVLPSLEMPLTFRHQQAMQAMQNPEYSIVILTGPSGTAKTKLACQYASSVTDKSIVVTRPIVSTGKDLGALPGDLTKKLSPWVQVIQDYLRPIPFDSVPLEVMRSRSFENKIVIADEMQNASPSQFKMCLTRIGFSTKLLLLGDLDQTDLKEPNGLAEFHSLYENCCPLLHRYIVWIKFTEEEVLRSPVVKDVLEIYRPTKLNNLFMSSLPRAI